MKKLEETGVDFEERVLGLCPYAEEYPIDHPFTAAVRWVKRRQRYLYRWNTKDPPTPLAKELFESVKGHLPTGKRSRLRLYVCTRTTLDCNFGTDAFFCVGKHIVTLDMTICRRKKKFKADFLVRKNDFLDRGIGKLASYIATSLGENNSLLENRPERKGVWAYEKKSARRGAEEKLDALKRLLEL